MTAPVEALAAVTDDPLARRSVAVLTEGQAASGAFVASPGFDVYRFGWLRDGAFCAFALDLLGLHERSRAFHLWAARAIEAQRPVAEAAIRGLADGRTPANAELLPTRYTLDGALEQDGDEPWPNFQLDGYGMWLWALGEHVRRAGPLDEAAPAAWLAADYLAAAWRLPCYGCWEEFDDGEHAATLAAVAAGLEAAALLEGGDGHGATAERIRARLLERFLVDGRLKRCAGDERVDGSLLWLAVPFGALPPDDPRIEATVEAVRAQLTGPGGGVRRYLGDTYYGGGEWILLACSLAWHDALTGGEDEVERLRAWVHAQARPNGDLPEQSLAHPQEPAMVAPWVERWGPVATPLLWSHAMHLIMETARLEPAWTFSR